MKKVPSAQFTLPRTEEQRFWLGVYAGARKDVVVAFREKPTEHLFPHIRHNGAGAKTFAVVDLAMEARRKNVAFSMELASFRAHFPTLKLSGMLREDGSPFAVEIAAVDLLEVALVVPVDAYGRPFLPAFE